MDCARSPVRLTCLRLVATGCSLLAHVLYVAHACSSLHELRSKHFCLCDFAQTVCESERVSGYVAHIVWYVVVFKTEAEAALACDSDRYENMWICPQVITTLLGGRMFGEGDLLRHLSQLTYKLMYHQDPLAEFDFSLDSMSSDLKDGLRLCKLAEALTGKNHVIMHVRCVMQPSRSLNLQRHAVRACMFMLMSFMANVLPASSSDFAQRASNNGII